MVAVSGWLGIILVSCTLIAIAAATYALFKSNLVKTRLDLQVATIQDYEARTKVLEEKQIALTAELAGANSRAAVLEQVVTGKKELAELQEAVNGYHLKTYEKMEQMHDQLAAILDKVVS